MKSYQSGISEFVDGDAVVFGVSTDQQATNQEFAESLDLEFALLSDEDGTVAKDFGIYMDGPKMAKRVTFVIDKEGKVAFVGEGREAMDPTAAAGTCSGLN